ncbi:uncharacterized protein BDW47DRAFT_119105 [Aspergillus candidus]|uniref:FAD-binding domain-containing protein n=1 Tax=Aspergillus candidus TaxID=41067 RepID=A0A2I2F647_ASPCN|nr:hypothetical protein BDW47DRAFT_119105 [Aspergillus candidus]PLB36091.1 hypothetical protein BDW47DRAFT_119105 [Aspergillus candidus]
MPPKIGRILAELGVWEKIAAERVSFDFHSIREGSSGKALGVMDCRNIEGEYGYYQTGGHRATLINTLYHAFTAPHEFHDKPTFWVTPRDNTSYQIREKHHVVAYPISGRSIYNISTTQPDVNFAPTLSATYTSQGSESTMLSVYGNFYPLVLRMLDLAPDEEVWSFALLRDACHPTLPYLGQGAAQGIKNSAILSIFLSTLPDAFLITINKTLPAFEKARKGRAEHLVHLATSQHAHSTWERRRHAKNKTRKVPNKVIDGDAHKMAYGFDCMENAREKIPDVFERGAI